MVIISTEQTNSDSGGRRARTKVQWAGSPLCLEFTDTLTYRSGSKEEESLNSYTDLLTWCNGAGVLSDEELQQQLREGESRPKDATQALDRARVLRETIYRIFLAVAQDSLPNRADLDALNSALARAVARSQIVATDNGFDWACQGNCDALDRVIWPVIWSATDLLTSEDGKLVKHCASSDCRSLFLDSSRNKRRRWCEMSSCGNRAKARRHYRRKRLITS